MPFCTHRLSLIIHRRVLKVGKVVGPVSHRDHRGRESCALVPIFGGTTRRLVRISGTAGGKAYGMRVANEGEKRGQSDAARVQGRSPHNSPLRDVLAHMFMGTG